MSLETQLIQALSGLLYAAATAAISVMTANIKNFIKAHTQEKKAAVARNAIEGLSKIAESVVADFNQRIVKDVKAKKAWTPELAEQVKRDAVAAVKSQGSAFILLIGKNDKDVEPLISTLIEQAISKRK